MTRATFLSSVTTMMMTAVIGMPMGHAQPAGGYQQSCEGSMVRGSTLISSCKDRRGIFHIAELQDFAQCVGDIFNDDGVLRCSRGARPPGGSYTRSCEQTFVDGENLRANCRNRGGGVVRAILFRFRGCIGDIANDDGALRCNRGSLPPAGSYTATCRSSFMDGPTLHSVCKTIAGSEVPTSLANVNACRSPIANIDGRLTCTTGSGSIPPGSYTASCRDIVVTASGITASCRTFGNAERSSTIANPSACRGPIDNIDGFLTCPMGNTEPPPGSYRNSCHAIVTNGPSMTASCRRGDGGYVLSTIEFASCPGLISNHQGVLTCPRPPPFIAVQSRGDGSFVVTGSSFVPNATVHITVADGPVGSTIFFNDTATPEGKLVGFPTGKICQRPGTLVFSATDGRVSNGVTITSNAVTITCPF